MSLATAALPTDPADLRAFALACQGELKVAQISVQVKALEIEKLKFQLAKLRRMQFGRSSERLTCQIEQLELRLEELETGEAEAVAKAEAADPVIPIRERAKPKRKPLPDHLPRQEVVHQPADDGACTCPDCGKGMARLGEDITEVSDYVPGHFQVIRHVRPKYACTACDAMTQAPAPPMPTPRGRATPAMLAHLLVSKFVDHLPLYRQSEIYARQGLEIDRSTLGDWVGQAAWLLDPVVAAIRRHVFAAEKIHGDDTTVPVLAPGLGRTATGRLWVYVRDDRLFAGPAAPAAAYFYSPDRGAKHPTAHMASFTGFLQADGYAGFEGLYNPARTKPGPITEVACWSHCRRKFYDVWETTKSPVAKEALDRIAEIYAIEDKTRWLLLGSGVLASLSHQGCDEGAQEGSAAAPGVVHELEEAEIERQLLLRDAPVRAEPGAQQGPRPLHGVDVDLAEAVAILVAGVLATSMADHLVLIAPGRQAGVDLVLVGVDAGALGDDSLDDGLDCLLLHIGQHAQDHLPATLDQAEDGWLVLRQRAAARRACQPAAAAKPPPLATAAG
jgi:transposase